MAIEEKIFLDCFSVTLDTKKLFIFSIDIVVIQSVFYVGCNVIKHKLPLFRFNISAIFAKNKSLGALLRQLYRLPFTGLRIAESCYLYLHTGSLYPWSHFDKTDEEGRDSSHRRSKNLKYNHAATNQFLGGIGSNPV